MPLSPELEARVRELPEDPLFLLKRAQSAHATDSERTSWIEDLTLWGNHRVLDPMPILLERIYLLQRHRRPDSGGCSRDDQSLEQLHGWLFAFVRRRSWRVRPFFPSGLTVFIDANPVQKGKLGCTYGTSLYNFHIEWPVAGTGIEKTRLFVLNDGRMTPATEFIRGRRDLYFCSRCGGLT